MHLVIDSKFPEIRRIVNKSLVQATIRAPQLTNRLIGDALTSFLSRGHPSSKAASTVDDQVQPWNKQSRLSTLLLSVVSFGDDVDLSLREKAVVEHIVLAHHSLLCSSSVFCFMSVRLMISQVVQIGKRGLTCVRKRLSIRMGLSTSILINCLTWSWMLLVRNRRYVEDIMHELLGLILYSMDSLKQVTVLSQPFVSFLLLPFYLKS